MDFITKSEHNESTRRLHQRIDGMERSSIRIEESSKVIKESVGEMHNLFYGTDGKNGLLVRISTTFERVLTNRRLIILMLVAIVGSALVIVGKALTGG